MTIFNIGKEVSTYGAQVVGLVSCVPSQEVGNEYFLDKFGNIGLQEVIKMIGVEKRRWVVGQTTTKTLCEIAARRLMDGLDWEPDTVDALLFVTQTPDYHLPATSCILQAELGLSTSCIAFDINLGCSGYPYALWLGLMMIQTGAASRVMLAVGDTISKVINSEDRSTAMLFGDAGSVTALESSARDNFTHFILGSDGLGAQNLIVAKGAFKNQIGSKDKGGTEKYSDHLYMDGGEIFNFSLRSVPRLLSRIMAFSNNKQESYNAFLFHQANLFMLKHLIKKSKLPSELVPINIDRYGNTSSASIPLLMTTNMKNQLSERSQQLALIGFGVGYSWAASSINIGPLKMIEMIEL